MKTLIIGRFQPLHDGHRALIQRVIDDGNDPVIGLRDTPLSEKNPYPIEVRQRMLRESFPNIHIVVLPNIEEVVYGRDVGYTIRRIHLSPELEAISATKIRNGEL